MSQIDARIVEPEYRNELQYKYYACDPSGHLTNRDAILDELMPALNELVVVSDEPEVVAHAVGMGMFSQWILGVFMDASPEVKQMALATCQQALMLSYNSPAKLAYQLIERGIDPVVANRDIFH